MIRLPGALIGLLLLIQPGLTDDCGSIGYTLECNKNLDPWSKTRDTLDILEAGSESACGRDLPVDPMRGKGDEGGCVSKEYEEEDSLWDRALDGYEKAATVYDSVGSVLEIAGAVQEGIEEMQKIGEVVDKTTEAVQEVAEVVVGATKMLQKGLALIGALATAFQFVGPILDIVMMFMPQEKSAELKAIESGFAKLNARMDAMSYKLDVIEGAVEWNAILDDLIAFESKVGYFMSEYKKLGEEINALDNSQPMPSKVMSMLENLVNGIRDGGNLGSDMSTVVRLFMGESTLNDNKKILEILMDAKSNDCSQILPVSNAIIKMVMDGQKLIHLYEVNQEITDPNDDKGYPRVIYDMYRISAEMYKDCLLDAPLTAAEEMERRVGDGDEITDIIDDLEEKFMVYTWATVKEGKINDEKMAILNSAGADDEISLNAESEDDQEDQRLTLYSVTKSSVKMINDVNDRIFEVAKKRCAEIEKYLNDGGSYDYTTRDGTITGYKDQVITLLSKYDDRLKQLFQDKSITMIVTNNPQTQMTGFHYQIEFPVIKKALNPYYSSYGGAYGTSTASTLYIYSNHTVTVGFLYTFPQAADAFKCDEDQGTRYSLTMDLALPYCLCDMGYGGDACDIPLKSAVQETDEVSELMRKYKVPGMFDIEAQINENTDKVLEQMEENKKQIFRAVSSSRLDMTNNKNEILTAQSLMINQAKANADQFLNEFKGLKSAMDTAFNKERNERTFQTNEGNRLLVGTITEANTKVMNQMTNLKGTVVKNQYFGPIKLTVPVFQERFKLAKEYDSDVAMEEFMEYFDKNKQDFNEGKAAVESAILAEQDSFISAIMDESMVEGCTESYNKNILAKWQELFQIHLSLTTIEGTVLAFEYKLEENEAMKKYLRFQMDKLNENTEKTTRDFKKIYKKRSCPKFGHSELLGGGCKAHTTHGGQNVIVRCSDAGQIPVLSSAETSKVDSLTCGYDSKWVEDVSKIQCVSKCSHEGKEYDIGASRLLPEPKKGYQWANGATQTMCKAVFSDSGATSQWDVSSEQEDVNECEDASFCGDGSLKCENKIGGFVCTCKPGYNLDEETGTCKDVDECKVGGVGYKKCLVGQNLGTCLNSKSSYECTACHTGAYAVAGSPTKECRACTCQKMGTTAKICDGTGACKCKTNVGGAQCEACIEGYSGYPECESCGRGYYNDKASGGKCKKCTCSNDGVEDDICAVTTGQCKCKEGVVGSTCDKCGADRANYPTCSPVPKDGTLSPWSQWSSWDDLTKCGNPSTSDVVSERKRRRNCDDTTKNAFGTSCSKAKLEDTETKTFKDTCRRVSSLLIRIAKGRSDGTSGKLSVKLMQYENGASCTTPRKTFDGPNSNKAYERSASQYSCTSTFDLRYDIHMDLISDSGDKISISYMGIKLANGEYRFWRDTRYASIGKSDLLGYKKLDVIGRL